MSKNLVFATMPALSQHVIHATYHPPGPIPVLNSEKQTFSSH